MITQVYGVKLTQLSLEAYCMTCSLWLLQLCSNGYAKLMINSSICKYKVEEEEGEKNKPALDGIFSILNQFQYS